VHLSNLDTRLAATLDTLDEIRRNHEMELETLHSQANSLNARCQIFKARAEEAEAERDGLKRDVNKLVEKGGRIYYTYGEGG
jgi:chromosome segregation ATPase